MSRSLLITNLTDQDTTRIPYRYVKELFTFQGEIQVKCTKLEYLEKLAKGNKDWDLVVGAGGGAAVDVAKFIGARNNIETIAFPTILSVDAFYTSSTAIREEGIVKYVPTKKPDRTILDYDLILRAPYRFNVSGWADILSIHTAIWDWKLASEKGYERFDTEVAEEALGLLEKVCRVDTKEGLIVLNDCLKSEVELCERYGSARPEEGSEHLFAYLIENYLTKPHLHGELVALGIYELSRIQSNRTDFITQIMNRIGLTYRAEDIGINQETVRRVLGELSEYSRQHNFFHTIVDLSL